MKSSPEESLIAGALAHLPAHIKANVLIREFNSSENFNDAELELTSGRLTDHFYVEVKRIHRKESLQPLFTQAASNTLLICNGLSPFLRDLCQQNSLNFIDTQGNISIQTDQLTIWVQQNNKASETFQPSATPHASLMSEGISKLLFVLAANPKAIQLTYRNLADQANVSLGLISKALRLLEEEKVVSLTAKPKRVLDEQRLITLWLESYRSVLRKALGGMRVNFSGTWQEITLDQDDIWGGEVAAEQLTAYLHAYDWQLFTHEPLQKKLAQLKCRPDATGNLWLVPAFWGKKLEWTDRTYAVVAIAELEASMDSRNQDVARMLYERYL